MDNRYSGVAILSGNKVLLGRLGELVEKIGACAEDSKFGRDKNWVAHLFNSVVTSENIFCDGCIHVDDDGDTGKLKLAIYTATNDARGFMQDLSSHLGVRVVWIYTDNYSGKDRACSFVPVQSATQWELRSLPVEPNESNGGSSEDTEVTMDPAIIEAELTELAKRIAEHTVNVDCLDCAVYHCALALDGIANYSSDAIPILKDRICADALIAGEAVAHLSSELFTYRELKNVTALMQKTAELTTLLQVAYEAGASSIHYMDRLLKPVPYHTVYSVLSNVRKLLTMLQRGEMYTQIVFKSLPRKLW